MNTLTTPTRITLERRELMALDNADGARIECLSGELWITMEGDAGDIVLAGGDTFTFSGTPRAFISALRPASFVATPSPAQMPLRRFAARCAARLYDAYRRWQHAPVAAMPVVWLR